MTENYFGVKIHNFDDFLETRRKMFANFCRQNSFLYFSKGLIFKRLSLYYYFLKSTVNFLLLCCEKRERTSLLLSENPY